MLTDYTRPDVCRPRARVFIIGCKLLLFIHCSPFAAAVQEGLMGICKVPWEQTSLSLENWCCTLGTPLYECELLQSIWSRTYVEKQSGFLDRKENESVLKQ